MLKGTNLFWTDRQTDWWTWCYAYIYIAPAVRSHNVIYTSRQRGNTGLCLLPVSAVKLLMVWVVWLSLRRAMGRHGRFDSKIFESAHHFRIESNQAADSNSNRISKLRRSLILKWVGQGYDQAKAPCYWLMWVSTHPGFANNGLVLAYQTNMLQAQDALAGIYTGVFWSCSINSTESNAGALLWCKHLVSICYRSASYSWLELGRSDGRPLLADSVRRRKRPRLL